jgi:F-type H+-transporting ATPase subunit b
MNSRILCAFSSAKRAASACLLALLLIGVVCPVLLSAQEPTAPAHQEGGDSAKQAAPGSQKETTEEKESDQTAQFKHSSSVRLIGRILGLESERSYWISTTINFVVIAGIIIWAGQKFLPGMFRARTAAIQKAMQEAQKASQEARQKLAEIEARLVKIDVEISAMRTSAEKEGAAEEARLKAAAEEDARKIVASAEQEIAAAAKAARRQLTAYAADLAVGLAQKQIHVDPATDQALVQNFAGQLNAATKNSGKDRN